ncbi:MAG TPA: hypothetical protein VGU43_06375, partial [Thermoplasmata archaeon]|nr:hypothetical protein [Thermoplasmata archaeon]
MPSTCPPKHLKGGRCSAAPPGRGGPPAGPLIHARTVQHVSATRPAERLVRGNGGVPAPKPAKEEASASEEAPEEKAGKPAKGEKAEKSDKGDKGEKGGKEKTPGKGKAAKGKAGASGGTERKGKPIPDNPNFRYIVRLAGSDLDGTRSTALAITGVRGVGLRIAETACRIAQVSSSEMIGNLPEATVDGLEAVLNDLPHRLPSWMLN